MADETFTNHYLCPCGDEWEEVWSCGCNCKCPDCNKEIEPYASDDGSMSEEEIDAALTAAAARMGLVEADPDDGSNLSYKSYVPTPGRGVGAQTAGAALTSSDSLDTVDVLHASAMQSADDQAERVNAPRPRL